MPQSFNRGVFCLFCGMETKGYRPPATAGGIKSGIHLETWQKPSECLENLHYLPNMKHALLRNSNVGLLEDNIKTGWKGQTTW